MATDEHITAKKAFDNLKKVLTPDDLDDFENTSVEQVWEAAREIERQQAARVSLRNVRRIEPVIRSFESYAATIEVFCQGFSPLSFVWGPIKLFLLLARQYENVLETILQAYKDIGEALPRIELLRQAFGETPNFQRVLALVYTDLLDFHQQAYKSFRRRGWNIWFAVDWGLFERRFKSILSRLAAHCAIADKEAAAIHVLEASRARAASRLEHDEYEERRCNQMTRDVFSWLSAEEDGQEEYLHRLADLRQPETCNWILKHEDLRPWLDEKKDYPLVWMTAIPGAGKSIICSLIIEHLQRSEEENVLYYFCGHRSPDIDLCSQTLRTLAVQMLQQNNSLAPLIHQAYLLKGSTRSRITMKKLLKDMFQDAKSTRVVIDGLDERDLGFQKDLLNSLLELQRDSEKKLKILLSSRREPQIDKALRQKIHIPLDGRTGEGLKLYIQHSIQELREWFPDFRTELLDRIETRLQEKAKGMFLWVRLVVAMLKDQATQDEFESAIEQLPDGLEEAYGRILLRFKVLSPPLQDRVYRILFWACAAFRPVKLEEVIDGIALKPGQTLLSKASRVNNAQRDILDLCAPIIERRQGGVLELVHFSAREFLLDDKSGPFIHASQAHVSIAFSCITNLTSTFAVVPRLSDGQSQQDVERMIVLGAFGLQRYAHHFWSEHVISYLATVGLEEEYDANFTTLAACMESFSRVRKDQSQPSDSFPQDGLSAHELGCLRKLSTRPRLLALLYDWLIFKKRLPELERAAPNLTTQHQWQLEKDSTYLSLIDYQLRCTTETLASMNSGELPTHIDNNEFAAFQARLGFDSFLCRYRSCGHAFPSISIRNVHEGSHEPSFPCLKCDFSGRGFTSRAALDKHLQKYHKLAEDFEIPTSLRLDTKRTTFSRPQHRGNGGATQSRRRSKEWSTKGQEVLQESFNSVYQALVGLHLGGIDSIMRGNEAVDTAVVGYSTKQPLESQATHLPGLDDPSPLLLSMKYKLDHQLYQTLQEFNTDIRMLSKSTNSGRTPQSVQFKSVVQTVCNQELERVMNKFPDFANLDLKDSTMFARGSSIAYADEPDENVRMEQMHISDNRPTTSDQPPGRSVYWSTSEEAEFPRLMQRHGWDFQAIADYYQTKTENDVEQHYNSLVESNAISAITMTAQGSRSSTLQMGLAGQENEIREPLVTVLQEADRTAPQLLTRQEESLPHGTQLFESTAQVRPNLDPSIWPQHDGHGQLSTPNEKFQTTLSNTTEIPGFQTEGPKKYKRRPKKAFCPHCTEFPDGLSSDHALKRHIKRVHSEETKLLSCGHASTFPNASASVCDACANEQHWERLPDDHPDLQAPENVELDELEEMFSGF
jgi:hypothetical protein